jgi:hypothetical protein
MDHTIDVEAEVVELIGQFKCAHNVPEGANGVGAAARNDVGLAPLRTQCVGHLVHGGGHVGAARSFSHMRTVQVVEKDIAGMLVGIDGRARAIFEQNLAPHAHLGRDGDGLSRMVRLRGTLRDDRVRLLRERIRHQEFELAGLVAPGAQSGAIVALDVKVRAAERFGQARHEFEWGGAVGDTDAGEACEFHGAAFFGMMKMI